MGEGTGGAFAEGMTSGLNFDENRKMPALQTRRIAPARVLWPGARPSDRTSSGGPGSLVPGGSSERPSLARWQGRAVAPEGATWMPAEFGLHPEDAVCFCMGKSRWVTASGLRFRKFTAVRWTDWKVWNWRPVKTDDLGLGLRERWSAARRPSE